MTSSAGTSDVLARIKPGLTGTAEIVVGPEHTAPFVGSGRIAVLATPVMINLIEAAALAAIEHLLPGGHQSLGIQLDISHTAATPVGLRVTATAEVLRLEGRTVTFRVEARDEFEPIGGGTHQRVVVSVARFDERVRRKVRALRRAATAGKPADAEQHDGSNQRGIGVQVVNMGRACVIARHECRQRAGRHREIHHGGDGANNGE